MRIHGTKARGTPNTKLNKKIIMEKKDVSLFCQINGRLSSDTVQEYCILSSLSLVAVQFSDCMHLYPHNTNTHAKSIYICVCVMISARIYIYIYTICITYSTKKN